MDIQQTLKKNQEELLNKMNLRNNSLSFEENMSHMIALGEFSEAEKNLKRYILECQRTIRFIQLCPMVPNLHVLNFPLSGVKNVK